MATPLYIDLDASRLVKGFNSTVPISPTGLFRGDVRDLNLYFLRQTGVPSAPYVAVDKSAAAVKLAIGDKVGTPTSGTWTLDGNSFNFDTTAALIQSALRTSQSDASLTVTGSMAAGFTITWGAVGAESALSGSVSGLLPECNLTIDERRAGTGSVKEQQYVRVRLAAAAFQDTFTDISTTVAATVSTVAGGSSTVSEVQKIAFDKAPISGGWIITIPADTRSVTAAVVAGVFTTTTNHGLVPNQPIVGSGFTNEANWSEGVTYFVKAVPTPTTFTISATSGGAALTTATADAGTGTITTFARNTDQLDANATLAEVQSALEALDCIGSGDVAVTGVPSSYYQIAYQGDKALANFPALTVDVTSLAAASGKNGTLNIATYQMADLIGSNPSANLSLEIQLIEGSVTETVISQDVVIGADLIDGATLSPVTAPANLFSRKTNDQSVTSSTTLVDCTELSLPVAANATYRFQLGLYSECGTGDSIKGKIEIPSGASVVGNWLFYDQPAGTVGGFFIVLSSSSTFFTSNGSAQTCEQSGLLIVGSTAGTVKFQFAQSTSDADSATIKSGSWIKAERVA